MIGKQLLTKQWISKRKQLGKPSHWCKKATCAALVTISHWNTKNQRTRKILRVKKFILLPLIVMVGIATNLAKLRVGPQNKILVYIREASKANSLTPRQPAVTLLLLKIRSKATRTQTRLNALPVIKKATIPANTLTKSQKTCVGLGNLCVNDWG